MNEKVFKHKWTEKFIVIAANVQDGLLKVQPES